MKSIIYKIFLVVVLFSQFGYCQTKSNNKNSTKQSLTPENVKGLLENGIVRCYTVENEKYLQQKYPDRKNQAQFEKWLAPKIIQTKTLKNTRTNILQTIPIIFHIITDGSGAENLSASLIQAQINQLNIDYRNLAGSPYSLATDSEIEFCLATQDENGDELEEYGINRVTTYGEGPFSQANFETTIKPNTQWDPTKYCNIWIGDLSSDLLGYAQFPDVSGLSGLNASGGLSSTDGVVVKYTTVGSTATPNPNGGSYDSGKTLTHELGHWLGLRHTWGDNWNEGDTSDASCGVDDYCDDTPNTGQPNYTCPSAGTTIDTCFPPFDEPDMYDNYMDYTQDACLNTFTANQVTRMLTVLANSPRRVELLTSIACEPIQIYDLDGRIEIDNLNLITCGTSFTPSLKITNRGNTNLTSATINYYLDGSLFSNISWSGNLAIYESDIITLSAISFGPGNHTFMAELISPNGSVDEKTSDNSITSNEFFGYFDTTSVNLTINPDSYGSEITWEFKDRNNTILYSGGPYTDDDLSPINESFDVYYGECYTFTIMDSYEDGLYDGTNVGNYQLTTNNGTIIYSNSGNFGSSEETVFSINSIEILSSILVYPNPANEKMTIRTFDNNLPSGYSIYNVLGQFIGEFPVNNQYDLEVNTSALSSGMYFIKVYKDGKTTTIPFIKN